MVVPVPVAQVSFAWLRVRKIEFGGAVVGGGGEGGD